MEALIAEELGMLVGGFFITLLVYAVVSVVIGKLVKKETKQLIRVGIATIINIIISGDSIRYVFYGLLVFLFLKITKKDIKF